MVFMRVRYPGQIGIWRDGDVGFCGERKTPATLVGGAHSWTDMHSFVLLDCGSLSNWLHSPLHSTPSHVTDPRCSFYKPSALRVQGTAETVRMQLFTIRWLCSVIIALVDETS